MSVLGLTVLVVSLVTADGEVPTTPLKVSMVAVQAKNEGRAQKYFGPGLEPVRRAVGGLDYDSFYKIQSAEVPAPYGEETKIYINEQYTLFITPVERMDDGRIRLKARITMQSRDRRRTINALDTTLAMKPGSHLNLGGLRLTSGELIVVVSVK